jgi:hypothetical protein
MKTAMTLFVASILTTATFAAHAATIQNEDQTEYQLRIVEDGKESQVALLPGASLQDLCKTKCDLYVGNDPDPYDLMAADVIAIKDGAVFDNRPDASSDPASSTPKQ